MDHVTETIDPGADPNLRAYMTFVSLFKLADFLPMDHLCRDKIYAFREYNIKKAIAI